MMSTFFWVTVLGSGGGDADDAFVSTNPGGDSNSTMSIGDDVVRCSAGFTLKEKRGNKTDGIDREYLVR